VLIHQHTRGESTDVLTLNKVDPTDARSKMEDMIDAFSRLDTSFVRCEISRSNFDFVSEVFDPSVSFCELVCDNDIRAT
jgi:hypothetical protein